MGDRSSNVHRYKKERREFACKSYFIFALFLIFAVVQWICIYIIDKLNHFFKEFDWVGIIFFSIGLITLILFIFIEKLRAKPFVSFLFAFVTYECMVLGLCTLIMWQGKKVFIIWVAIWTIVLIIIIVIGSVIPHDLTLDVVVLFVLAVICTIGAMYFLMLYMLLNVKYSFYVFRGFITFSIILFVMYHAQIINGSRFAEMRISDYFLAALILFIDFILLFIFDFFLAEKWSDECDKWHKSDYPHGNGSDYSHNANATTFSTTKTTKPIGRAIFFKTFTTTMSPTTTESATTETTTTPDYD